MNQEPMSEQRMGIRDVFGTLTFLARSVALPMEVFLHRTGTFGERYIGLQAGGAVLLILFWPVFCEPTHDLRPMLLFLLAFLGMSTIVRVRTSLRARRSKPQPHTRYNGTPRLMRFLPRMDEVKVKCIMEPLLTWLVGALMLSVSPPLAGFIMVASFGLLASNKLADESEWRRASDMHDAYLDQRRVVERFRDLHRD